MSPLGAGVVDRALCLLVGYAFGCVLTAEIVSKAYAGKSTADIGTGNPGMANVMGHVGKLPGALTLAGDIVKTVLAVLVSWLLFGDSLGYPICANYACLGAVVGHDFPFWKRFKGGKGVTVTCSWMVLGLALPGVVCDLAGAVTVFLTGWLPLAAVVIVVVAVPVSFATAGAEVGVLVCVCCALMFSRHWHGLRRIARGEEKETLKIWGRHRKKDSGGDGGSR